jgi:hypothetical protein
MNATQIERAAYVAAHRIVDADASAPEFAWPAAQRSRAIDAIAEIIKDVLELECDTGEESADCQEQKTRCELVLVKRRHTAVVIEFPRRAIS